MDIEYDNEEIEVFITKRIASTKPFVKYKSNRRLLKDIDKVMIILQRVNSCSDLARYAALHYEHLKYEMSGLSSVRLGYDTKYRLIFKEVDGGIKICVIEISEHYGDK